MKISLNAVLDFGLITIGLVSVYNKDFAQAASMFAFVAAINTAVTGLKSDK
jgi:hypothetical protein